MLETSTSGLMSGEGKPPAACRSLVIVLHVGAVPGPNSIASERQ